MNRRILPVALALALPIPLFIAAKAAASWRPIALTRAPTDASTFPTSADATSQSLLVTAGWGAATSFDLAKNTWRPSRREGIARGENVLWRLGRDRNQSQLAIARQSAAPRVYQVPVAAFAATFATRSSGIYVPPQVTLSNGHVNLLVGQWFCRWNANSGQLERARTCDIDGTFDENALSLDGETIVNARLSRGQLREVSAVSTRTGGRTPRFIVRKPPPYDLKLSPNGRYAIYQPGNAPAQTQWEIYDAASGKRLWNLPLDQTMETVAFAPDEKSVAVERTKREIWEIRDAQTGEILRTLPLHYDTIVAGFSPDGKTLYSVADGVLYRQRAR